jgi:hypothetical protein
MGKPTAASSSVPRGSLSPPSFYTIIFFLRKLPLNTGCNNKLPDITDKEAAVGVLVTPSTFLYMNCAVRESLETNFLGSMHGKTNGSFFYPESESGSLNPTFFLTLQYCTLKTRQTIVINDSSCKLKQLPSVWKIRKI